MQVRDKLADTSGESLKTTLARFVIAVIFSIAFAYIEAAVVVYLRRIFHPEGFTFPLTNFGTDPLWERLLLVEIGREVATLVLISAGAWLFGRNLQQRAAYFFTIFATWDIFYYVWLKVLIDWPTRISDWDILFLIPITWASPVLAPLLISLTLLIFAMIILYRCSLARGLKVSRMDWLGFILAALVVVISFCAAGLYVTDPDFQPHFYWPFCWPLFGLGYIFAIVLFLKCLFSSK